MSKRYHDWYRIQQEVQRWKSIPPDLAVAEKLIPMSLTINFDYCHYGLKNLLLDFECPPGERPDFYVVTELELGKKPLEQLFEFYRELYENSRVGIYIATLSYYINVDRLYPDLTAPYSKNIDLVFRQNLSFADNIENASTVIDFPLIEAEKENFLVEGSNYIFVHPNIKYWLWKN